MALGNRAGWIVPDGVGSSSGDRCVESGQSFIEGNPAQPSAVVLTTDSFHSNQAFHCLMKTLVSVKFLTFFTERHIFSE